jgi:hypothetical protein
LTNSTDFRGRADALRAIKFASPLTETTGYGTAYTEGVAALAADLFATLGETPEQVGDTLRAAGVVGHCWEGRMVGEACADRLYPVSAWLLSLLGPGYYRYSGEYQIDLQVPGSDTTDSDAIAVPVAVRDFLGAIEDPYDDELDRYRGLVVDDQGRPAIQSDSRWMCAGIHAGTPDKICGASVPCPTHPGVVAVAGGEPA